MIVIGSTVICVRRRRLTVDDQNYALEELTVGQEYQVTDVNDKYSVRSNQVALSLKGKYYEHALSNFKLKQ